MLDMVEFAVLDSCAHVGELERTCQGPFQIEHCLKEDEISISTIHSKILENSSLVENYLDTQMAKFRSIQMN